MANVEFSILCEKPVAVSRVAQNSSTVTYTVTYSQSILYSSCSFSLPESLTIPPTVCNISTQPLPLLYDHQHPFLALTTSALEYCYRPIAFILWVLMVLGIDPFDTLINAQAVYLAMGSGWLWGDLPSVYYQGWGQLRYLGLDYLLDNTSTFPPAYKLLVLVASAVAFQ